MKWTEITGVDKNVDFKVKSLSETYRIVEQLTGYQRVCLVLPTGELTGVSEWAYDEIINSAPSGIIHLPPPLTDEQREQLRALYTLGYFLLAMDKNGEVFAYSASVHKCGVVWTTGVNRHIACIDAKNPITSLVSWSDPEPYDIGKALGVGE